MSRASGPLKPSHRILGTDIADRVESVSGSVTQFHPGDEIWGDLSLHGHGTFPVQLGKYFGAEVTGADSTEKLDVLRSIGANHVVDCTQEDFTRSGQCYDLILDVVVHRSIFDFRRAMHSEGICVMVGGSMVFLSLLTGQMLSVPGNKKIGLVMWRPNRKEDLDFLAELFQADRLAPVIDRCYPLSELPEALQYLEEGHAKGKIAITADKKRHSRK